MKSLSKIVFLAATALILASCAKAPAATPTAVPAEPTAAAPAATAVEPTAAAPVAKGNSCLDCHGDKDTLVANLKEEVKVESESTGVG
ncbi:MAG TPA: hypothetical protein PKD55_14655 [Bellilinea sp.]|nr:hypothetical protein [Bellilinea sp.]